jgi:CBS domain-containing protein
MGLRRITQAPLVTVDAKTTVLEAVRTMNREQIGAVIVMEGDTARGICSERDIMLRVVLEKLDPEKTRMTDIMTFPLVTIPMTSSVDDALKLMLENHIRHIPVVKDGKMAGMVSIRNLLHEKVAELTDQLDSLEAYFSADGSGG